MEWAQHGSKINSQGRAWIPAAMIRKSRTITAFYSLTSCWACNKTPMQTSGIPSTFPKPSYRRGEESGAGSLSTVAGQANNNLVRFVPFPLPRPSCPPLFGVRRRALSPKRALTLTRTRKLSFSRLCTSRSPFLSIEERTISSSTLWTSPCSKQLFLLIRLYQLSWHQQQHTRL